MSSSEFTNWIAWYLIADGQTEERPPTPEELGGKLSAWAAMHNASAKAGRVNAIAGDPGPRRDDGAPRRGVS